MTHIKRLAVSALLVALMGKINVHIDVAQSSFSVVPDWSFDGERVAMVEGTSILVYDVESGELLHRLDSHTDTILSIDWSPVDYRLASASNDQTVKVWDTSNGSLLFTLSDHQAPVSAVVWSPDGTEILSWGFDTRPNLFVWDASTGELLARHNSGSFVAASFSPDGSKLALSVSLGIGVIDPQTFEAISNSPNIRCCTNQMYSISWSSNSDMLVTGSINGILTVWDDVGQIVYQLIANSYQAEDSRDIANTSLSWVRDVSFGVDGSVQAVSGDGTVRRWDTQGNLLQEVQIGQLETAAWSPYGARLAVQMPSQTSANGLRTVSTDTFRIEVPFASLDRLNAIAELCVRDAARQSRAVTGLASQRVTSLDALPDFVAQVEALPEGAIPAACRADLLAVADALR
jgi:WD40 repeat protein